jgi:hypothetical protein
VILNGSAQKLLNLKNKQQTIPKNRFKYTKKIGMLNVNQRLSRACIVHLVIKRTKWFCVKSMSCSGSHLGIPINIKNTKFVKDLPMINAQFRFNQCNSFREEWSCVNTMTCGGSHLGFGSA